MAPVTKRRSRLRRVSLEVVGWTLVIVGIALLVLPGPGMLTVVAGLAILSQQYPWAQRRLETVKEAAFRAAAEGVSNWRRIATSCLGALTVVTVGAAWTLQPHAPTWWPLADVWWLPGGVLTGATVIFAGLIALGLVIYSIRRFRRR